jgi:hypothetical protein
VIRAEGAGNFFGDVGGQGAEGAGVYISSVIGKGAGYRLSTLRACTSEIGRVAPPAPRCAFRAKSAPFWRVLGVLPHLVITGDNRPMEGNGHGYG